MNTTTNTRVSEAMEALRPFANAYRRLRHYGDSPTDETPLYAYAGEGHPLYELLNGEHGERLTVQTLGEATAALEAALSAEPAAQGEVVAWQYRRLDEEEGPSPYWHHMTREQYEMFRDNPRSNCEVRQLFTAPPAQPAERVPEGCVVVRRSMLAETVRVLKNVDTQFRATGQPSGQVERLVNFLAPLTASPAPSEGEKEVDRGL